jgi:assimilatory nitrate reductase catalytic subunit
MLGLDVPERVMRYVDAARGVEKSARIDDGLMTGVCLSGETAAAEWLKNMMQGGASLDAVRPWILAPVASPPKGSLSRGRIVCNCFDVALSEIHQDARAGLTLADIQSTRKCGTSCGSCLPEVKRIIGVARAAAPAKGGQTMPASNQPANGGA